MHLSASMLVSIGRRPASEGLVDLLGECHHRIRTFLRSAERLAIAGDRIGEDTIAAASDIHRYFSSAFPLHLADEDESIAPRLRDKNAEIDRALATMSADHQDHGSDVRCLVDVAFELRELRTGRERSSARLATVTATLAKALEPHLELEERVLFPAIRALAAPVQLVIVSEMRARREHVIR